MDLNDNDFQKGLKTQVAPCIKELWTTNYREYIYYGSRYGGKNHAIADFLGTRALEKKTRILILREFQTSGRSSVYKDIQDFFENNEIEYQLGEMDLEIKKYYQNEKLIKFKAQRIVLEFNKSEFIFAGINNNVVDSLKGLKDIDFCWIDEANFLTEFSYNKLKPTIRALNSKLIFSFNPEKDDDFLYQKAINNKDERCFVKKITASKYDKDLKKWVCGDNPFLNETILADINSDFQTMTPQMFAWVHLGEPLGVENGNVINTEVIGYFNDSEPQRYDRVILTADTAFSKNENADYSVIGVFCVRGNDIHLTRIFRGRWDFNELQTQAINAYEWAVDTYHLSPTDFIIEKKASGISLLQELKRLTHLPLREVTPKKDKFTRVSSVLSEFQRLKLPMSKNPLNSWVSGYLSELKAFRADEQHLHDDMVDCTYYALDFLAKRSVSWSDFL